MTELLTKLELATRLGISTASVDNFRNDGLPRKGTGRGTRYPWDECFDWFVNHEHEKRVKMMATEGKMFSEKEAKARKMSYEAELKSYELQELKGSMVAVDRVEKYMSALTAQLKDGVLAIPALWVDQLVGIPERAQMIETLDGLSRKLLTTMATKELNLEEDDDS